MIRQLCLFVIILFLLSFVMLRKSCSHMYERSALPVYLPLNVWNTDLFAIKLFHSMGLLSDIRVKHPNN